MQNVQEHQHRFVSVVPVVFVLFAMSIQTVPLIPMQNALRAIHASHAPLQHTVHPIQARLCATTQEVVEYVFNAPITQHAQDQLHIVTPQPMFAEHV